MKHTITVGASKVKIEPAKHNMVELTFDMDDFDLDNILDEFDTDDILRNIDETDIVSYLESIGYTVRD